MHCSAAGRETERHFVRSHLTDHFSRVFSFVVGRLALGAANTYPAPAHDSLLLGPPQRNGFYCRPSPLATLRYSVLSTQ